MKKGICLTVFAIFILMAILFPIYWIFSSSVSSYPGMVTVKPEIIPSAVTLNNFRWVLFESDFLLWLKNSLTLYGITIALVLLLSIPSAYALSRFSFFGKKAFLYGYMMIQFIPLTLVIIPLYVILAHLGMLNSLLALAFIYAGAWVPIFTWLLKTHFDSMPKDYDEAAIADGASYPRILYSVMLPMVKPGLGVVIFLTFIFTWGEFIIAQTILNPENYTLAVGLSSMTVIGFRYGVSWPCLAAMAVLVAIPPLIAYSLVQRFLRIGLTLGGLKG